MTNQLLDRMGAIVIVGVVALLASCVEPPLRGQRSAPDAPPATPPPTGESFFIYPKNGQSQEQQSQDRYECHAWASEQTGFDPTKPGGGVAPDQNAAKQSQYRRAMMACLKARGYSVR